MVCAQVIGHHAAITVAGQSGNFQLNVMLPLIASDLLDSIGLLANVMRLLADRCIAGLALRRDKVEAALDRNPILVTALNPLIGYERRRPSRNGPTARAGPCSTSHWRTAGCQPPS